MLLINLHYMAWYNYFLKVRNHFSPQLQREFPISLRIHYTNSHFPKANLRFPKKKKSEIPLETIVLHCPARFGMSSGQKVFILRFWCHKLQFLLPDVPPFHLYPRVLPPSSSFTSQAFEVKSPGLPHWLHQMLCL